MPKKQIRTVNTTLIKLHGTPFKKAAELKAQEEKILLEEWQNIERARVRLELLMKEGNRAILAPFLNGLSAKFVGPKNPNDNMIRIFLTDQDSIQIEIDSQLRAIHPEGITEHLVKSMVSGLFTGYLTALGLVSETQIKT